MRWKRWVTLAVCVMGLLIWGGCQTSSSSAGPPLQVQTNRLLADVQTLARERYRDEDLAEVRTYLSRQLTQAGYTIERQTFELQGVTGVNLVATRPGLEATAGTLLVGAHYDSVQGSPGADDNASAVAAALEIARLFADYPTPATLKVVFFDQEERQPMGEGILGSSAFVLNEENVAGLKGAVILEMLGYTCETPGCQRYPEGLELEDRRDVGDFVGVIGNAQHPDLLTAFAPQLRENFEPEQDAVQPVLPVITLPVPLAATALLPDLFRSDHAPFWVKGIGAVMVTDTADFRNPNYHRPTDTVESLDFEFLERVTQHVVLTVERLLGPSGLGT